MTRTSVRRMAKKIMLAALVTDGIPDKVFLHRKCDSEILVDPYH